MHHPAPALDFPEWTTRGGDRLGFREWAPAGRARALVVAMHGLNLTADDFAPLGEALAPDGIHVAAWNLRGQGLDPDRRRRGAFLDPRGMLEDLEDFIAHVRRGETKTPLFLCGDSMGALLALHAATDPRLAARLAGLILFVPVVHLAQRNPEWIKRLISLLAKTLPRLRINARWFVHAKSSTPQLTRIPERQEAIETSPYRLGPLTVGFLASMGALIDASDRLAGELQMPVAVLSAGHDVFITASQTGAFFQRIASADKVHFHYPEAFHQLLFDLDREQVLADLRGWLASRVHGVDQP
jgi:alpha-beta hydrolase superfamily lysophospholipase